MTKPQSAKIDELEADLTEARERIKELRNDLDAANELVDQAREQLEENHATREQWIDAFHMQHDDEGLLAWPFQAWLDRRDKLSADYEALVKDWNRFVPIYNATLKPPKVGRPLQASEAQVALIHPH